MRDVKKLSGVFSPVITPFKIDLTPDINRMVRHCQWLVEQDVGLAIFGTNSEANSLSVSEKINLFEALLDAGIPVERMMPGTGCCALSDSVELTRKAVQAGAKGVLMLPPFYYKGVSDEGLFASYSEVIQRVGDDRLRIYLYHIPQVAQVSISLGLIERLLKAYPNVISGIKDSSGDWKNTKAMLDLYQPQGFDVFAGSESFLLANMRAGGVGCITATGNVNPSPIVNLYKTWQASNADEQQKNLDAIRNEFAKFPMIPALKAAVAFWGNDGHYATVRPPLVALIKSDSVELIGSLKKLHFSMPGF
jgi:4-hydroxy-tetrahydrodipicolinate synthase